VLENKATPVVTSSEMDFILHYEKLWSAIYLIVPSLIHNPLYQYQVAS
jgi:hypothetical protein